MLKVACSPIWEVEVEDDVCVHAAPMSHSVPCVGYVVTEQDKPGRLKPENVLPVIDRNRQGLIDAGIRNPMKVMAMVKVRGHASEFASSLL